MYQCLVLPHFDYCDTVYACTTAGNLSKLQLLQNSACRTMLRCNKRTSVDQMHKDLEILKLDNRRKLHLSMECHKAINEEGHSLARYFNKRIMRTTRAGETRVEVPNRRTNMGRRGISFRGPNHWEKLPSDIKTITSKTSFRSEYLKILFREENHPT